MYKIKDFTLNLYFGCFNAVNIKFDLFHIEKLRWFFYESRCSLFKNGLYYYSIRKT